MIQQQILTVRPRAFGKATEQTEHERELEGLPIYWKMSWGYDDVVIFDCGHACRFAVYDLENPDFKPVCRYKQWGACNE